MATLTQFIFSTGAPLNTVISPLEKSLPTYTIETSQAPTSGSTDVISNASTTILRGDKEVALIEWKALAQTSITITAGTAEKKGLVGDIFVLDNWPNNSLTVPMPDDTTWKWKLEKRTSKSAAKLVLLDTGKRAAASYLLPDPAPEEGPLSTPVLEVESTLAPPVLDYVVISWVIMIHHIETQRLASKADGWASGIPGAITALLYATRGAFTSTT
ncbi:hypothetical protein DL93DRAFT_2085411 [Clavulina sp. PMI_390]|nr:hypothetical protein DL93DRAFT_2085411 [Clavulina sp. PMI_390]